jgi:hypothetical protein
MLGIASSVTDSTATAGTRILASRQTTCGLGQDMAAAGDDGRPRAPKAAGRKSGSDWPDVSHGASPSQASGCGLVIHAKSVRDAVKGGVNAELLAADALGLRYAEPSCGDAFQAARKLTVSADSPRRERSCGLGVFNRQPVVRPGDATGARPPRPAPVTCNIVLCQLPGIALDGTANGYGNEAFGQSKSGYPM